jgi:hypothetical protein
VRWIHRTRLQQRSERVAQSFILLFELTPALLELFESQCVQVDARLVHRSCEIVNFVRSVYFAVDLPRQGGLREVSHSLDQRAIQDIDN